MGYSNIKKMLTAALLVVFTAPVTLAVAEDYVSAPYRSSMFLSGAVKLTDNDDTITLSLRDSDVKQVLRMFADKAGLNVVFHNSVSGKVTLDLVNTPLNEAFNLVLQISGMSYYQQGNVMIVMSKTSPDNGIYSKQEMLVFPVKYVSAAKIADFLNKNVFSMKRPGMSGVDAATVNSATNELIVFGMQSDISIVQKVIEQFDKEPFTKTFAVNHTTPAEMANMICNLLLPARGITQSGGSSAGSASVSGDGGLLTGGAADSSEASALGGSELKLGEGIIACSISSSASGEVAPFDVQNLSIAYFPQRGTITLMGGSEAQASMIENFIKSNDVKQPQAYLEVAIIELNEEGSKEFNNEWTLESKNFSFSFDSLNGATTGSRMFSSKPIYVSGTGSDESSGLLLYPPSSTNIYWTLKYLVSNSKGRVLANPKILITNGQESVIDLTQDYVEKVTSEYLNSSSSMGTSMGTVQRTYTIADDLGIKVTLIPFISPEGYVTLNIQPEYSTVLNEVRTASAIPGESDLQATLLSRRDLDLKNVRIKDNETLVLGGLIQELEKKVVRKIPFLGDLPCVGSIFRSSSTSKTKNELVIMITPRIIDDGEGAIADSL